MNIQNRLKMVLMVGAIGLFGCGGGSSSSTTPATSPTPAAKTSTTISGKVSFPSLTALVAKQVAAEATGSVTTVQAYTLEGVAVGAPIIPIYDSEIKGTATEFAKRVYKYELSGIPLTKDYVIKSKRVENGKIQELKKLIEKKEVVSDPVVNQDLSSVSTATVIIASKKVSEALGTTHTISLGDPLPQLGTKTVADLSSSISTVAPKTLETTIQTSKDKVANALANGNLAAALSSMTAEDKSNLVEFVNTLNIVDVSVANNADPLKIIAGGSDVTLSTGANTPQLKLLSIDPSGAVAQAATAVTTLSSQIIQTAVEPTPSRVALLLSTTSTSLYGVTIDVTVPADATVVADAAGGVDSKLWGIPSGCSVVAKYSSATRVIRMDIVSPTTPLPATVVTASFARTSGKTLSLADFTVTVIKTTDENGKQLSPAPTVTGVVTLSGT